MSRDSDISRLVFDVPTGAAGSKLDQQSLGDRPFLVKGFAWSYYTSEANSDNTFDFALSWAPVGTNSFTTFFDNGNAIGLGDTGPPGATFDKMANPASGGGAAVSVASLFSSANQLTRIPASSTVRLTGTTAGTGTIPRIQVVVYGTYL